MRRILILAIAAMGLLAIAGGESWAAPLLAPGDFIIGIDLEGDGSRASWPGGENPPKAIDGIVGPPPALTTKYLNFGQEGSGLIVTPSTGSSTVQSLVFYTGGDAEERDPASYELYGTNSAVASMNDYVGLSEPWTLISSGGLTLPAGRNTQSAAVDFANATPYLAYKLFFPTLKNVNGGGPADANSMQINEIQLYTGAGGTGTDVFDIASPVVGINTHYSPDAEAVDKAIDGNLATKYLNFAKQNSGFIVTPASGPDAVRAFEITTANDAESRDPTSWILWGTNDPIMSADDSLGDGETWTLVDSGLLNLPSGLGSRNVTGPLVFVDNDTAYASYRMVFPTMRDPLAGNADSVQWSEVQFYNTPEPGTLALAALAFLGCLGARYRRVG